MDAPTSSSGVTDRIVCDSHQQNRASERQMRMLAVTLPGGRISLHERPIGLPDHVAFVDRSMTAEELFALLHLALARGQAQAEPKKEED